MPVSIKENQLAEASTAVLEKTLTVAELKRALEKISGQDELKQQHFSFEITPDGKRLYIRPADFDPLRVSMEIAERLKTAESGAWTTTGFEKRFELSPATLHRRRKEHRIVYWRDAKHDFLYPKWQFTPTGALLPGVQEVLQVFQSDDEWRVMRYFLSPRRQLGNESPLALLRAGRKDDVIAHAKAHAAENTW